MKMRSFRIGPALLPLVAAVACSSGPVIRTAPGVDANAARAAAMNCSVAAGLLPHEEIDLKINAATGGYGDRIREDPELQEIFGGEFAEVWVYARDDRYEVEVHPTSSSSERAVEQLEGCLREKLPAVE
jgi:hypothetical protein